MVVYVICMLIVVVNAILIIHMIVCFIWIGVFIIILIEFMFSDVIVDVSSIAVSIGCSQYADPQGYIGGCSAL